MADTPAPLTLYLPAALDDAASGASARFPCLETIVARGAIGRPSSTGDAHLLTLLGGDPAHGIGRAAVSHFARHGSADPQAWRIIAAPRQLIADHQTLHLASRHAPDLSEAESRALLASCQAFFAEEGWQLDYGDTGEWYLQVSGATAITTTAPAQATGRTLFETLPQGSDAGSWRRWGNEVQMLFHDHPVNVARRSRGAPPINTLWFWGEGRLPRLAPTPWQHIFGGDRFVQGLAQLAGIGWSPLPAGLSSLQSIAERGPWLLLLDEGDHARWEKEWFCPLRTLMQRRGLAASELHFRDGHRLRITPPMYWRFWRRHRRTLRLEDNV